MISKKIYEVMISQNENEKNYRSAVILSRLKSIVTIVLRYSDTPASYLWEVGIYYDKKNLQLKVPTFSRYLCLPQRIVLENMQREGFMELTNKPQNELISPECRCFTIPTTNDGVKLTELFANPKFTTEQTITNYVKEKKEPIVNYNLTFENKKFSIKLPPSFTFTTEFPQQNIAQPRDSNNQFLYFDPNINLGTPSYPKSERTANQNTVFIIDPTSTWMSTMEVRNGQDLLLSQLIQPQIDDDH